MYNNTCFHAAATECRFFLALGLLQFARPPARPASSRLPCTLRPPYGPCMHPACPCCACPAQTALPESCSVLRKDFGGKYFEYTIGWSSSSSFADCNVE